MSQCINCNHRISDEKDARGYLQVLAAKMKEELEYLKQCPNNNGQSALVRNYTTLEFNLPSCC